MTALLLSYGAGWLITLSPCVLPILPLMLSGAMAQNRAAPLLMAGGLSFMFALAGTLIAAFGAQLSSSAEVLRLASAGLLLVAALFLLVPAAGARLGKVLAPLGRRADGLSQKLAGWGAPGYVLTGGLLGLVWAPCSGPALVAALGLAADAGTAAEGFVRLLAFGLGAASPLLLIAYGARGLLSGRNRARAGQWRPVFGALLGVVAVLILTGADLGVEEWLLQRLPDSVVRLSVRL